MDPMQIYNKSPIFLQNIASSIEGLRISKTRYNEYFWKTLYEYETRKEWDKNRINEFKMYKLKTIINHAYKTVPYYNRMFKEFDINPLQINDFKDLEKIPILTKQDVNNNFKDFISTDYNPKNLKLSHTSGTTGSGFKFYTTQEAVNEQWAVWWRYRKGIGLKYGEWSANFGSKPIVPFNQKISPYWRINYPGRQIYFSAFHLKEENLYYYFQEIKKRKIRWIHGFPSLITPLAHYIIENNLDFGYEIKFVTTGAENLLEHQKKVIENAFGVLPYQHYGLAEGVANISEDSNHNMIIDEDFAIVELKKIKDENFKIIGTNLTNFAMPLLRWDTTDTLTFENEIDSRGNRIINKLNGRDEDYVYLKDGRKIGKLDHIFKDTTNIIAAQIHQTEDYNLKILFEAKSGQHQEDIALSNSLIRQSVGHELEIEFIKVDKIPRTNGGKIRFVVSELTGKEGYK